MYKNVNIRKNLWLIEKSLIIKDFLNIIDWNLTKIFCGYLQKCVLMCIIRMR